MSYGFSDQVDAMTRAQALRAQHPENRYEVAVHKHAERSLWGRENKTVKYGVLCYVPYCDAMTWRCDGFVWFERGR